MSFDIKDLHIEQTSQEGQNLQAIIERDHVSPEDAVLTALRQVSERQVGMLQPSRNQAPNLAIAEEMPVFGIFANNPMFSKAMDEILANREERYADLT